MRRKDAIGGRQNVAQTSCLWGPQASCLPSTWAPHSVRSRQRGQDARDPHRLEALEACATFHAAAPVAQAFPPAAKQPGRLRYGRRRRLRYDTPRARFFHSIVNDEL